MGAQGNEIVLDTEEWRGAHGDASRLFPAPASFRLHEGWMHMRTAWQLFEESIALSPSILKVPGQSHCLWALSPTASSSTSHGSDSGGLEHLTSRVA